MKIARHVRRGVHVLANGSIGKPVPTLLTADHFGDSSTGGWQLTDKWQLIYPPTTHAYCFRPGQLSQALEMPLGIIEDPTTRMKDSATLNARTGTYVFAGAPCQRCV